MAEDVLYNWTGTNRAGKKISGEMRAENRTSVKVALRKQGIAAKTVKKQGKSLFSLGTKITPADIAIFTRQLATMMKAGVPLVQSFEIVAGGVDNVAMKDLIRKISAEVSGGNSFAASIRAQHREHFEDLFCNLVRQESSLAHLKPCSIAWRPIKRRRKRSKPKSKRDELPDRSADHCWHRNRHSAGEGRSSIRGCLQRVRGRPSSIYPNGG